SGQLGDGSTTDKSRPVAVASGLPFSSISVGSSFGLHTCALTTAGAGYCWGRNNVGQLGDSTMTASLVPVPVAGGLTFQSISAGSDHTCGLTPAGEAYCWGDNAVYQLGGGMSTDQSDVPRVVPGGLTFQNISAGDKYTCGVAVDGTGYCWGFAGDYRDLGQGDRLGAVVQAPAPIVGGIVFQTISAGSEHTCGISTASVAYCWGSNTYGRLGTTVAIGQKNGFPLPVRSSETF